MTKATKGTHGKENTMNRALAAAGAALLLGPVCLTGCSDSGETEKAVSSATESTAGETEAAVSVSAADFDNCYLVSQMNADMLDNFLAMYDAVSNFKEEVVFPHPIADEDEKEVYTLLLTMTYECPELFQLDWSNIDFFRYEGNENEIAGCDFAYRMDQDSYSASVNQCQGILSTLQKQTDGMSDYDKELYVYDYLAGNSVYDDTTDFCDSMYGMLVEGRAKCDGISSAFKYICDGLDLPCVTLFGYGDEDEFDDGHAWNAVSIDGEWYDVDLTAEVPREDSKADSCWYYGALNVPRTWITDANSPVSTYYTDYFDVPESVSLDADYHVVNDEFVAEGEDFAAAYRNGISRAFDDGDACVYLQFESSDDYNAFLEQEDAISSDWLNNDSSDAVTGLGGSLYRQEAYRTIAFVPEFDQ